MPKLISLSTTKGSDFVVEVRTPEGFVQPVGAKDVVEKLDATLDSVYDFAINAAKQFADVAKQAGAKSSQIELGIGFTAKGTVFVCETSGEATIKLTFSF